jgi:N-acetylmuramoyl-L-alanine amidase
MRYFVSVLAFFLALAGSAVAKDADFYKTVVYPMALNVYHEARGESEFGQMMVAYVTLKRAEANRSYWGGATIHGVVYKNAPCQFSWTCAKTAAPAEKSREWQKALAVASYVALGFFTPPAELEDARFYMNPDASDQHSKCWFAKNLRQVGIVGNHYFYQEGKPFSVPPRFKCDTA